MVFPWSEVFTCIPTIRIVMPVLINTKHEIQDTFLIIHDTAAKQRQFQTQYMV